MNIKQFFLCSHRSHCFGARVCWSILALATILWPQCAPGQHPAVPKLTLTQVQQLVSNGVPDSTLSTQIQRRGLAFVPTPATIESLRAKGAGPLTLQAIQAAPRWCSNGVQTFAGAAGKRLDDRCPHSSAARDFARRTAQR